VYVTGQVVVVGASVAGLRTAQALRDQGFDGRLVLIGDEPRLPYDKPPLSKQFLAGTWDLPRFTLLTGRDAEESGIELRLGSAAVHLHAAARQVELADGAVIDYDDAVIATGASARPSPWKPESGLHLLRTATDVEALTADLRAPGPVLIVGAGVVGCEVAATMRSLGREVVLVDTLAAPMERVVGAGFAARLAALHHRRGVVTRFGTGVRRISGTAGNLTAELTNGTVLSAAVAVVGIGSVPNDAWLRDSGLEIDDGVVTDEFGRAIGCQHVYAVGDVARTWHPAVARHMRAEHWSGAVEDASRIARTIVHPLEPVAPVLANYVWSDQYDWKIQVVGTPGSSEFELVGDLEAEKPRAAVVYGDGDGSGGFGGVITVNWPTALVQCRRLLAQRSSYDAALSRLTDLENSKR
jgi:phthalate 3,4-dioxygenase ferredoxin reductase subunit